MGGEEMTDLNEIQIPVSTFSPPSVLVTEQLFPREAAAALCYTSLYLLSLLTPISPFSLTLVGLYSQYSMRMRALSQPLFPRESESR